MEKKVPQLPMAKFFSKMVTSGSAFIYRDQTSMMAIDQ